MLDPTHIFKTFIHYQDVFIFSFQKLKSRKLVF